MNSTSTFSRLFSPVDLRGKTLRNRIVFGAHTANMADQGIPGERHLGYYRERAMGEQSMNMITAIHSTITCIALSVTSSTSSKVRS